MRVSTRALSSGGVACFSNRGSWWRARLRREIFRRRANVLGGFHEHGRERSYSGRREAEALGTRGGGGSGDGFIDVEIRDELFLQVIGELLAHSVEPVSAYSSPSQLQTTIVRRGRMPSCLSSPRERVSSIMEAVPLEGSTPPKTQASR